MLFARYRLRKWMKRLAIVDAKIEEAEATANRTGYLFPVVSSNLAGRKAEAQFMVSMIQSSLGDEE